MFNQNLIPQSSVLPAGGATEPVSPKTAASKATASERTRAADIRVLYQLAADYDSISPKLAAQLREIAQRH